MDGTLLNELQMPDQIEVQGLCKRYPPEQWVLSQLDLRVNRGEFVAITGRSGNGKTSLLNILGGLDTDYTGLVKVNGQELQRLQDRQLSIYRNQQVGFVFQSFHLLGHLTCLENILLPSYFTSPKKRPAENLARAKALLSQVDLSDKLAVLPGHLSGGQKQRVAIARALFHQPAVLLCDEPTGSLDQQSAQSIIELFGRINVEQRVTVLVVTHDPGIAAQASRIVVLEQGRAIEGEVRC